ncbi:ribonuclease P protein component [Patescibacteria group bacterium]|nr:ribonuclease P protein component [Patescibacteria group bacterium]
MLKRKFRLTRDQEFRRLRRKGFKERSTLFWLRWLPNNLPYSRFGFIASKKVGNAVQRNRATRLVREVVRLDWERMRKGIDVVFVLSDRLAEKSFDQVEREVKKVFARAKLFNPPSPID